MTYNEAVKKINSMLTFGIKPGLERIIELMERLGSPDRKLRFIHIAGTNGKGSTSALIASALSCAGYKTGLFISPYVLEFRERFMINGKMIPEQTLADIVEEIYPITEDMRAQDRIITEFEFVFAVAVCWYQREGCDFVVLETGLGGRFDATNMIDRALVDVITSISLDHTAILGGTYGEIAREKCGILRQGGTCVVYADQQDEAMAVIKESAAALDNDLIIADGGSAEIINSNISKTRFVYRGLPLEIRLIGDHQVKNAAVAADALFALRKQGIGLPDSAILEGFGKVSFPARLELMSESPLILLDGAHNPGGTAALAEAVKKHLSGYRLVGITGMLRDKDVYSALSCLVPLFDSIYTTEPDNPRKMTASDLRDTIESCCRHITVCTNREQAYSMALSELDDNSALVIFGSLYLASDMRRIILESKGGGI